MILRTGSFRFPSDGDYTFSGGSDDGVRVWIDGSVYDHWSGPVGSFGFNRHLSAGLHQIIIEYWENTGPATIPHVLALGGERGWSARDRDVLRGAGFRFVHLGSRVLRISHLNVRAWRGSRRCRGARRSGCAAIVVAPSLRTRRCMRRGGRMRPAVSLSDDIRV